MQSTVFFDRPDYADWLELACGAVLFVGLFAMKFLGPPPPAFVTRVAIVFVMLCTAAFAQFSGSSTIPALFNLFLGLILLAWYARE
jgi:hypothetical protein